MADGLEAYRAKRDFQETPEPAGDTRDPEVSRRFVVQEHSARAMHWDLRLEHEGTLASWAIPKGIPADPKRNNLAVRTDGTSAKEYIDDSAITAKVKAALVGDSRTKASQIEVETREGVVQLAGFVNNSEAKATAEELARGIDHVKSVDNQIDVKK